jgi:F0F1-type ATP synthase membrane subunit b/b'
VKVLWWQLRALPWALIMWQSINFLAMFILWVFTKWHLSREWLQHAPEKARDQVQEMRRALAESEVERQELMAENARLRGMVRSAKVRLSEPRQAELVER